MFGEGYDEAFATKNVLSEEVNVTESPCGKADTWPRQFNQTNWAEERSLEFSPQLHNLATSRRQANGCSVLREVEEPLEPRPMNRRTVQEIVKDLDEVHDVTGRQGGWCARFFIPAFALAVLVALYATTLWTSGSTEEEPSQPRVALILFEGFGGTHFYDLLQGGMHLVNLESFLARSQGQYAACAAPTDVRCARAAPVVDERTSQASYTSGSGLATILSGVPPSEHQVTEDTFMSYTNYSSTSKTYPSIARRVMAVGKKVAVMGSSHLLHSFDAASGRCRLPGVLDVECAASAQAARESGLDAATDTLTLECLPTSTCNMWWRVMQLPTNSRTYADVEEQLQFTRQLKALFGELLSTRNGVPSSSRNEVAMGLDASFFVFHFNELAFRSESDFLSDFTYNASSMGYAAQVSLLDAMVGQVLAYVSDRVATLKENWLVLGTSDHGGAGKSHSGNGSGDDTIPFFLGTLTSSALGHVTLSHLTHPTTQLDVLPTVLRWLNIAPFDDATVRLARMGNLSSATPEEAKHFREQMMFTGRVQGICSSGFAPINCKA